MRSRYLVILWFLTTSLSWQACQSDPDVDDSTKTPEEIYFDDYQSPRYKWGFMNTSGEVLIKPRYDQVSAYSEGLAAVNFKGRWGYINAEGRYVIEPSFKSAWSFSGGYARVISFDAQYGIADQAGEVYFPQDVGILYDNVSGLMRFERGFRQGFLHPDGSVAIEPIYDKAWNFDGDYARVRIVGKEGIIDKQGRWILPADYDRVYPSADGIFVARSGSAYTFVDSTNTPVLEATYTYARPFRSGRAIIKKGNHCYLLSTTGDMYGAEGIQSLRFAGENCWVANDGRHYGLVNSKMEPLTDFIYQQINNFSDGLAVYNRDDYCGYLNPIGTEVTPPHFGLAWDFQEGLARAAFRDGIAYIDRQGRPALFERVLDMQDFSEGLAGIQVP